MSGLGIFDRILGFIFGAGKIFFIVSIIVYAMTRIEVIKTKLDEKLNNSFMYPVFEQVGSAIIKLDSVGITNKIEQNIDSVKTNIQEDIIDNVVDNTKLR
jgi:membrane protein required for colicin V production